MTPELAAELNAMIDHDLIAQRRAELEAVRERQAQNTAAIAVAQQAVADAEASRAALLTKIASGAAVPATAADAADMGLQAALKKLAFLRDLAGPLDAAVRRGDDAHSASFHEASAKLAARGAREYIAACERLEVAQAEVVAAQRAIDAAVGVIDHARANGSKLNARFGSEVVANGWAGQGDYVRRWPTVAAARETLAVAGLAVGGAA